MDPNQFGIEIAKKFQQFFAHMNKFCQQFLKDQNVTEIQVPEKKKERDPNAPKKPLTPFFLFNQKYREKVVDRNPEIKLTQISQMAGNKWSSMSEQEKKPYVDQYNAAKEKYEQELKDYNEKNGIETNDKKRKKSEKVDDKSMKSALDHNIDDFESESVQPAAKHQQQIKQQQQKQSNNDEQVKQQPAKQSKQQTQQKQIPVQTKKAKHVEIDDDIQKDIDQAMSNPKQTQKKSKK
ncbi:unnamed protein product (macronuclear) [Paramecium tetraurelia]|uniref:HMG box domain-containing protein n=1 Tax=Paramecium tetraurelia TaxID=5888 RepID=A0E1R7_PARTE|nr:uncharacterized protein GSPATT00022405001 [Paramecium tetraurelia]CAK89234.1 unnamed protein product [Paramecium tetraurelia]|eukprot:XP_001456631.1 hypothetical protein (macronuclear) [Paramecium tetraurelia strain d4-2]